ncbi:MAG: RHS repeat protein [Deltaproteobacteria bacterium]|nr:RHS repeat protein [Deltaproteobacteria bacterium]
MEKRVLMIVVLLVSLCCWPRAFAQNVEYQYDDLNRLYEVVYPDGTTTTYAYDEVGNRLTKQVQAGGPQSADIVFAWRKKVKAFDVDVSPPQVGTRFSPGTNLKFKIKVTVQGDAGTLCKVKLAQAKIVLPYLPAGDPERVTKLTNPQGKKVDVKKNLASGDTRVLKMVGRLPTTAQVGERFKFKGQVKLFEMGSTTPIKVYSVARGFNIVQ